MGFGVDDEEEERERIERTEQVEEYPGTQDNPQHLKSRFISDAKVFFCFIDNFPSLDFVFLFSLYSRVCIRMGLGRLLGRIFHSDLVCYSSVVCCFPSVSFLRTVTDTSNK